MPRKLTSKKTKQEFSPARELARRVLESLVSGKIATKFVDDYADQFHRPEASAHPARRNELEAILEREILLAMTARIARLLEEKTPGRRTPARGRRRKEDDPAVFLRDFLSALTRESGWTAGDSMEFRGDLDIYRRLASAASARSILGRSRTNSGGPFVDRCAILLDPSMIENATRAAGKLLLQLETLTDKMFLETTRTLKAPRSR